MWIILMIVYFIVWASTLLLLFKRIRSVDRLLPNKKVFITHAIFLGLNLFCMVVMRLSNLIFRFDPNCDLNCAYLIYGTHNIMNTISIFCDYATYVIVLYMLVPRAKEQAKASEHQQKINFMMINGLKNVGTIQSVIEENNMDMTDERISEVSL